MSASMLNNGVVERDDPLDWPINDDVVEPVAPAVTPEICKIGSACKDLHAMLVDVMKSHPMKEKMDDEISVKLNRLHQLQQALGGSLSLIAKDQTKALVCNAGHQWSKEVGNNGVVKLEFPAKVFKVDQAPHEGTVKPIRFGLYKLQCAWHTSMDDPTERWIIDHVYVLTGKNGYERCHRSVPPTVTLIRGGNTYLPVIRETPEIGKYNQPMECTEILDGDQIDIRLMYKESAEAEVRSYPVSYSMTEQGTSFPVKVLIV